MNSMAWDRSCSVKLSVRGVSTDETVAYRKGKHQDSEASHISK
jgi:hypothetical protein